MSRYLKAIGAILQKGDCENLTECADGTYTTAKGRGACAGHGGIKGAANKMSQAAEKILNTLSPNTDYTIFSIGPKGKRIVVFQYPFGFAVTPKQVISLAKRTKETGSKKESLSDAVKYTIIGNFHLGKMLDAKKIDPSFFIWFLGTLSQFEDLSFNGLKPSLLAPAVNRMDKEEVLKVLSSFVKKPRKQRRRAKKRAAKTVAPPALENIHPILKDLLAAAKKKGCDIKAVSPRSAIQIEPLVNHLTGLPTFGTILYKVREEKLYRATNRDLKLKGVSTSNLDLAFVDCPKMAAYKNSLSDVASQLLASIEPKTKNLLLKQNFILMALSRLKYPKYFTAKEFEQLFDPTTMAALKGWINLGDTENAQREINLIQGRVKSVEQQRMRAIQEEYGLAPKRPGLRIIKRNISGLSGFASFSAYMRSAPRYELSQASNNATSQVPGHPRPDDAGNWTGCARNVGRLVGTYRDISACFLSHYLGRPATEADLLSLTFQDVSNMFRPIWDDMELDQLTDQDTANLVMHIKVHFGNIRVVQRGLNDLGENLTVDGVAGPLTRAALQRQTSRSPNKTYNAIRNRLVESYSAAPAVYRNGFLRITDEYFPAKTASGFNLASAAIYAGAAAAIFYFLAKRKRK